MIAGPASANRAGHTGSGRRSVAVRPTAGGPATTFTVGFRAPDRAGPHRGAYRYYAITATGPSGDRNCVSQAARDLEASRAHARVRVELSAGAPGWCVGPFRGTVTEQERPICPYGEVCPLYIVLVRTIGRFTFHVRQRRPAADTTPPSFAGLQSATACTPGPQRPGEKTPYHLAWKPARDNVTRSSQIVYDVFMSAVAGAEDFSHPNWTTPPGATHFTTPGLPSHGTVYFVVRARDRAGNEDTNDVERRGVDPCL